MPLTYSPTTRSTLPPLVTNLIESTHPGDGANVVGDGDQRCPCQVLFGHRLPLFFEHHVAKTNIKTMQIH